MLTPTRELCIQVTQALRAYGEGRGISVVAVFGGAPIRDQASRLKNGGGQIVVGTVGRVLDMINRHHLYLDSARYVVLDEADEMLDLGFLEDVETILRRCPAGRQTALFSATVPPEIRRLADTFMHDPTEIKVRAATLTIDTVEQFYLEVPDREKPETLVSVLKAERPTQAIVFARTKIGVDRLARRLGDAGVRVKALHGDLSQGQRDGVMIAFKSGRERLLVATDVAARGLDITGVSHVVNYDIPNSPDVYVHRIGRTGRAGESGRAITLITPKQRRDLEAIEKHAKTEMDEWSANGGSRPDRRGEGKAAEAAGAEDAVATADAKDDGGAEEERGGSRPPRKRRGRRLASVDPDRDAAASEQDEPGADAAEQPVTDGDAVEQPVNETDGTEQPATEADGAEEDVAKADADGTDASERDEAGMDSSERGERPRRRRPRGERETRRPRHTKPNAREGVSYAKLVVGAGEGDGIEPADIVGAIVDHTKLENDDVRNVRVLQRFSFVSVPDDLAQRVATEVSGKRVRGVELRLEVTGRK